MEARTALGTYTAGVHDGIEGPALERIDPFVAIPVHVFGLRMDVIGSRTAMEDRHLVPSFQRHARQRPARELRSADHQQLHPASFCRALYVDVGDQVSTEGTGGTV